jgi:hypothetical protein
MALQLTYGGSTLTLRYLQAQPIGYAEAETEQGLTARRFTVAGLCTPAQWVTCCSVFDAWQAAKIQEAPTLTSRAVGATVALTCAAHGRSVTSLACWFTGAPAGETVEGGVWVKVSFSLIDAAQQLTVLLRQNEKGRLVGDAFTPSYGTIALGATTLALLEQPEAYEDGPSLEPTSTGGLVARGPLVVSEVRNVKGVTDASGWAAVQSWFKSTIAARPGASDFWPVGELGLERDKIVSGGAVIDRFIVSVKLKRRAS